MTVFLSARKNEDSNLGIRLGYFYEPCHVALGKQE